MKLFSPIVVLLLCASCVSSSEENANKNITDKGKAGSDSITEVGKKDDETDSLTIAPETKMIGDWLGFILDRSMPTKLTGIRYRFLDSGTWEILEPGEDAEPKPQGWYKIIEVDSKLLLQPHELALLNEDASIVASLSSDDMFIIPNPLNEDIAMTFIREKTLAVPTTESIAGKWTITQMDLETNEKRVAQYKLVLKDDFTYSVEQPDKKLPAEWATGTYTISGITIQLKNDFTGTGLWHEPSFFLLDGKLRYNDSQYCVWCEK